MSTSSQPSSPVASNGTPSKCCPKLVEDVQRMTQSLLRKTISILNSQLLSPKYFRDISYKVMRMIHQYDEYITTDTNQKQKSNTLEDILPIVLSTDAIITLIGTNSDIALASCNTTTATRRNIKVLSVLKEKKTKKWRVSRRLRTTIICLLLHQIH